MHTTSQDSLAIGLAVLAHPEVTTRSTLLAAGSQMWVALERAAKADDWLPQNELFHLAADKLVNLGFLERSPERIGQYWHFRITPVGKVFAGYARGGWRLPGWVSLKCSGRDEMHIDLKNAEHVALMRRLLAAGWTLANRF